MVLKKCSLLTNLRLVLEKLIKITCICSLSLLFLNVKISAQENVAPTTTQVDSSLIIYSLFAEYYKNKDYISAMPYGFKILKLYPEKYSKWVYYKMEDLLWQLHDSTSISPKIKNSIEDTILYFYDLALKYDTTDRNYFEPREAFVEETWLNMDSTMVIADYEKAIADNPNTSSYYYNRLGQLYIKYQANDNDYKSKAIDLFTKLSEREPDNPQWPNELQNLVENLQELAAIDKKAWDMDKDNLEKAWTYASVAMKAGLNKDAISVLEFLVSKSPETINYWAQLASAYQKVNDLNKAESSYKKLIQLEPDKKEDYLNLGIVYKDKNQYSLARSYYEKASEIGKGWALPIFYLGNLYEQSARGCEFNFETKLVYLLAQDTYRRAKNMDPTLEQAAERITALNDSIPSKEDYFFRGYKSGQTLPITGKCYGWIQRSVTVP
jgi:tetratricopeptide (TPR) repeat protein